MIRVILKSWTASFRHPTFQLGHQPTLPVPPLSTIQGILSSAKGDIVYFEKDVPFLGYVFKSEGMGVDLERIYVLGKPERDVIRREVLFNASLYLYLPDEWEKYFRKPVFQLLLGRSSDIAMVKSIKKIELVKRTDVPVGGTVVPLDSGLPGIVYSLPVEFDYSTVPRKTKSVMPFIVLPFPESSIEKKQQTYNGRLFYDPDIEIGIWMYSFSEKAKN